MPENAGWAKFHLIIYSINLPFHTYFVFVLSMTIISSITLLYYFHPWKLFLPIQSCFLPSLTIISCVSTQTSSGCTTASRRRASTILSLICKKSSHSCLFTCHPVSKMLSTVAENNFDRRLQFSTYIYDWTFTSW